jgi:hypothetical protein
MSHLGHIKSQATKGYTTKIFGWAKYEAAQTVFEEHRKKLIHSIMEMDINEGMDFYT